MKRLVGLRGHAAHRVIEDLCVVGMLGKEFPNRLAECFIESDASGAHAIKQLTPCRIMLFAELGHRESAYRSTRIRSQRFQQGSIAKAAIALGHDADARQSP